jgi:phosphoserine phosphatase RsbU/P
VSSPPGRIPAGPLPGRILVGPPPGRILVVDDTEVNRDLLARRLRALGHEVEMAVHGRDALDVLAAKPIDLVLLDIMMPEMDGFQVLEHLRTDARLKTIPVIMISAVDEIAAVAKAIELGATDYLPKPFNAVVLRARVTATLEKKRLEDAERQRTRQLERELEIGRRIQREFLPETLPQPEGWQIAASFHPARQVAGDFYDVFVLEDGRLAIAVGDVCDKGVGAALFMALFRSLLRSHAELHGAGTPPESAARSIVALTNDYIARVHSRANMFSTIFFGLLDPSTGALAWVNGGQDPPAVRRLDGSIERLTPTGSAVGLMPEMEFKAKTTVLGPGDVLLAFTDGASEARSPEGGFYGEDSVIGILEAAPADAAALLERIVAGVRTHEAGAEPGDDLTLVAIRRLGDPLS